MLPFHRLTVTVSPFQIVKYCEAVLDLPFLATLAAEVAPAPVPALAPPRAAPLMPLAPPPAAQASGLDALLGPSPAPPAAPPSGLDALLAPPSARRRAWEFNLSRLFGDGTGGE